MRLAVDSILSLSLPIILPRVLPEMLTVKMNYLNFKCTFNHAYNNVESSKKYGLLSWQLISPGWILCQRFAFFFLFFLIVQPFLLPPKSQHVKFAGSFYILFVTNTWKAWFRLRHLMKMARHLNKKRFARMTLQIVGRCTSKR